MESAAGHGGSADRPVAALRGGAAVAGVLTGVAAVAGFAVGRATRIERREITVTEAGAGRALESAALDQARTHVRARLYERVARHGRAARNEEIDCGRGPEFLDDPELNETASELIQRRLQEWKLQLGGRRPAAPLPRSTHCRMRGCASAPTICSTWSRTCCSRWPARPGP